ncbi:unnamed protein product [Dracunculus medinensis]|uniref:Neur_chan_LBD domain-containing protein n=1 Tax=Dracunculus medinensis TaxID=318479 RepID=A0A0N4U4Z3_DRAME|nr:unnamed protein product [Dracunculus medinensis]
MFEKGLTATTATSAIFPSSKSMASAEKLAPQTPYHSHIINYRDYGSSFILPVLKSVNYDNTTVPTIFPDVPVNVRVQLNIIHLSGFDSQQMDYTVDAEMEMRWFDIRLANNYSRWIRIWEKSILEQIWKPDPYFVNSKHSYFHEVSFPNFRMYISPEGLIIYTLRITLQPTCQMIFCRFPHDRQECDLLISSISFPQTSIRFSWHSSPVRFLNFITLPELKIRTIVAATCQVENQLVNSSCLKLGFKLERDGARFIVEKYIPSTLAMMFAWIAPYVPYYYEEVRIITPITVLLALVQMEKGEQEIRTSYLTSIDTWFGAMKVFSALSLIESMSVKQSLKAKTEFEREVLIDEQKRLTRLYHRLDTFARFVTPFVFLIFFLYYVIYVAQATEDTCVPNIEAN